jgi:hypothetical protein
MAFVVKACHSCRRAAGCRLNAFNEELTYKASFLRCGGCSWQAAGASVVAAFFGLLHFYGVPYACGVILAAFLGGFWESRCWKHAGFSGVVHPLLT